MHSCLHNLSFIDHQNLVGACNGGKPVRDDDDGLFAHSASMARCTPTSASVSSAAVASSSTTIGAFFSNARAMEMRWRSPPESPPADIAQTGVPALRKTFSEFQTLRGACGLGHFGVAGFRPRHADVSHDGVVKQVDILKHDRHPAVQGFQRYMPNVHTADEYPFLLRVGVSQQQARHGRFARSGRSDQRGQAACRDMRIDSFECGESLWLYWNETPSNRTNHRSSIASE